MHQNTHAKFRETRVTTKIKRVCIKICKDIQYILNEMGVPKVKLIGHLSKFSQHGFMSSS